jgi:hypothetical protein
LYPCGLEAKPVALQNTSAQKNPARTIQYLEKPQFAVLAFHPDSFGFAEIRTLLHKSDFGAAIEPRRYFIAE